MRNYDERRFRTMNVCIEGDYADFETLAIELYNRADQLAQLNRQGYDNLNLRLTERAAVLERAAKMFEEAVFTFPKDRRLR